MASFKCPQCHADVTKDKEDELGCPCCGYAAAGSLLPYFPFQLQPFVIPTYPQQPWYIGDPVPTEPTWPIITWGDDGTIQTSGSVKITVNEDGSYSDHNGNRFQVSYTSGHAQA